MSRRSFPYGDGRAGPRIAAIVEEWLEKRTLAHHRERSHQ
jgi:UDP-N-acetylglucosamine 2-epimerase